MEQTFVLQVFPIDTFHNLCLCRINDQMSILVFCVSGEPVMIDLCLSVLIPILQSQFDVLAQGLTSLLYKTRHNGKQLLLWNPSC